MISVIANYFAGFGSLDRAFCFFLLVFLEFVVKSYLFFTQRWLGYSGFWFWLCNLSFWLAMLDCASEVLVEDNKVVVLGHVLLKAVVLC